MSAKQANAKRQASTDDDLNDADHGADAPVTKRQTPKPTPEAAFRQALEGHALVAKLPMRSVPNLYVPIAQRFVRNTAAINAAAAAAKQAEEAAKKARAERRAATDARSKMALPKDADGDGDGDGDDDGEDIVASDDEEEDDHDDDDDDDDDVFVVSDDEENDDDDDYVDDSAAEESSEAANGAGGASGDDDDDDDDDDGSGDESGDDRDEDVHIGSHDIDPEAPVHLYLTPQQALNHLLQGGGSRRSTQIGIVLVMKPNCAPGASTNAMELLDFVRTPLNTAAAAAAAAAGGVSTAKASVATASSSNVSSCVATLLSGIDDDNDGDGSGGGGGGENGKQTQTPPTVNDSSGSGSSSSNGDDNDDKEEEEEDPNVAKVVNGEYVYDDEEEITTSEESDEERGAAGASNDDLETLPDVCRSAADFRRVVCHYGRGTFTIKNEQELLISMDEYLPLISGWLQNDEDGVPAIRMSWEKVAQLLSFRQTLHVTMASVEEYYRNNKLTKNAFYLGRRPPLPEIDRIALLDRLAACRPR